MDLVQAVKSYDYKQFDSPAPIELTEEQLTQLVHQLKEYHAIYSPYFRHTAQVEHAYNYLLGLLKPDIERKSAENIALATVGIQGVRSLQTFLGQSRWKSEAILDEHQRQTGELLGDANGVMILDGSDCAKQGSNSVGVQRQWCGELGKTANCQAGVYVGYSSCHGYSLLDCRLYLPEIWFTPDFAGKRYQTGIPSHVRFQTKNELAWQMIAHAQQLDVLPIRWLTMDEAFGKDSRLLERIATQTSYLYFAEVPKDTRLWASTPQISLPTTGFRRQRIRCFAEIILGIIQTTLSVP